jgi:hypothetical protein
MWILPPSYEFMFNLPGMHDRFRKTEVIEAFAVLLLGHQTVITAKFLFASLYRVLSRWVLEKPWIC